MVEKSAIWYECKVRLLRTMENGALKKVTECYIADALSCTEAEARVVEELKSFYTGPIEVRSIRRAKFREIVFDETFPAMSKFYLAKITCYFPDEKTGFDKPKPLNKLVECDSLKKAVDVINDLMKHTMIDYEISALHDTGIMDVYKHEDIKKCQK